MSDVKYTLSLSENGDRELGYLCYLLKASKTEVVSRAMALLKAAVEAETVQVITGDRVTQIRVK